MTLRTLIFLVKVQILIETAYGHDWTPKLSLLYVITNCSRYTDATSDTFNMLRFCVRKRIIQHAEG